MEQTACVDIKFLPLQLLLREHRTWRGFPVVVVERDAPQGIIQWANPKAAEQGILPGMRYGAALSLSNELHGGTVSTTAIESATASILRRLWLFSPSIEPSGEEPGIFWLNASGLSNVFPSSAEWAASIRHTLRREDWQAVVAVGFSRFGSYASARASSRNILFETPQQEHVHVQQLPVECLGLEPGVCRMLLDLGVDTVGEFRALPESLIVKRFGPHAVQVHRRACGTEWNPLRPHRFHEPIERRISFDWAEHSAERLLPSLIEMLEEALATLCKRHEQLEAVDIFFRLENGMRQHEHFAPAAPTQDIVQLQMLLRLRMERIRFSAGVEEIVLRVKGLAALPGQLDLFQESWQNLEKADRALAAIRAAFGNGTVLRAEITDGHLPEAQYHLRPLHRLEDACPQQGREACLIRRIELPAKVLPHRERHEPDGWLPVGMKEGPVEELYGPYHISGGWWTRETARAYQYARTRSGRWFWLYYDEVRRRWFLHGEVQ